MATSAGVILGLWPYFTLAGCAAVIVFVVVVMVTRYISLSSMAAALVFPIAYGSLGLMRGWDLTGRQLPLGVTALVISALVLWRHRENMQRLLHGSEHKVRTAGAAD